METWVEIEEFPNYQISSYGQVVNVRTDRLLALSEVSGGAVTVKLNKDGVNYTRSVKVLVAEAFVPRPPTYRERVVHYHEHGINYDPWDETDPEYNTPVQLDNNYWNCRADNIVWRTRSFAWHYKRQFLRLSPRDNEGPLQDVDTGELYKDVYTAATINGLLFRDVWACAQGYTERIQTTDQRILFCRHINAINQTG